MLSSLIFHLADAFFLDSLIENQGISTMFLDVFSILIIQVYFVPLIQLHGL